MNIKTAIVLFFVLTIFVTGCSTSQVKQTIYNSLQSIQNSQCRRSSSGCPTSDETNYHEMNYHEYEAERQKISSE